MTRHRGPKKPPAAKKPPLTHFLCVPLVTSASREPLAVSLQRFSDAVSLEVGSVGGTTGRDGKIGHENLRIVHPKAIRPVGAIHLTLGVMSLGRDQLSEAVEYLNSPDVRRLISTTMNESPGPSETRTADSKSSSTLDGPITPPATKRHGGLLEVELKGIESMHAAHKTSILYIAPTDESGRLYPFCVALQKLFRDKGFLVEDNRQLKLHATIVNMIYAKERKRASKASTSATTPASSNLSNDKTTNVDAAADSTERSPRHVASSRTIDATAVLEAYKDYIWVDNIALDRIAVCEMGAKKIFDEDGIEVGAEYTEVASVSLSS